MRESLAGHDGSSQPNRPAWIGDRPAYLAEFESVDWSVGWPEEFHRLIGKYGYAIPNEDALLALAQLAPLIEVGAGAGYWTRLLRDRGVDIDAYDQAPVGSGIHNSWTMPDEPWAQVAVGGVEIARSSPARTLFLCWPERGPFGAPTLIGAYGGEKLALVTDGPVKVGSDPLYHLLESDWTLDQSVAIPRFPYRFDSLMIWTRNRAQ